MPSSFGFQCSLNSRDLLVERQDVGFWTNRCNREWVDLLVTLGVMFLDVRELGGTAECVVVPVTMSHPSRTKSALGCEYRTSVAILVYCWVATADITNVALEVLYVDDIEADYGLCMSGSIRIANCVNTNRIQSNICLRYPIAVVIRTWGFGEVLFHAIERLE